MKRRSWIMLGVVLALALLVPGGLIVWNGLNASEVGAQEETNLLVNPGFEAPYTERGASEVKVAESWYPWYAEGLVEIPGIEGGGSASVPTGRPEYKAATLNVDAYRIRSGAAAQCWFSFSRTNYAGVLQQVAATAGKTYQASVYAQAWCSNEDNNPHDCPRDRMYISLGIDPDGGTWYKSRSIVWTQWQAVSGEYQEFASLPVVANKGKITVYIASGAKWSLKHMDMYIDDAALVHVGQANCPTPMPCPTGSPCPTSAPCPTGSPCPTNVPGECQCVTLEQLQAELDRLTIMRTNP